MGQKSESPAPAATGSGAQDRPAHQQDDREDSAAAVGSQLPVTISEWPKNKRGEVVRVALDSYNGNATIDLRIWWPGPDGELKPSRSGLTVGIKHLEQLAPALQAALEEARRRGLLDGGAT